MNQTAQQDLRDEEIVALCQQGQREVFEVLVRKYMERHFGSLSISRMTLKKPRTSLKRPFCALSRGSNNLTADPVFIHGSIDWWSTSAWITRAVKEG